MEKREVEVKARVRDLQTVMKRLAGLGCVLSDPVTQVDRIFIPKGATIPTGKGVNVLRIRKESNRMLFTLKQVKENQLDKIEKEFTIGDEQQAVEAILLLGFEESVSVEKRRRKCRFKDYEICIDSVTDLGEYIEVEKITDEEGDVVQEELFTFLTSFGVKKEDQEFFGYDILLYRKNHSA